MTMNTEDRPVTKSDITVHWGKRRETTKEL